MSSFGRNLIFKYHGCTIFSFLIIHIFRASPVLTQWLRAFMLSSAGRLLECAATLQTVWPLWQDIRSAQKVLKDRCHHHDTLEHWRVHSALNRSPQFEHKQHLKKGKYAFVHVKDDTDVIGLIKKLKRRWRLHGIIDHRLAQSHEFLTYFQILSLWN